MQTLFDARALQALVYHAAGIVLQRDDCIGGLLKNYLRCHRSVENRLKMLIYKL